MELFNVQIRNKLQVLTCIDYENINWMSKTLKKKGRILSLRRDQKNTKLRKPNKSDRCWKCKPTTECCSLAHNEFKNKKQKTNQQFDQKAITIKASSPPMSCVKQKNECLLQKLDTVLREKKNHFIYTHTYMYIGITKQCCLFKKKFILYKL